MNIYLDNAATTKLHPLVIEKMLPFLRENYGNPSSIHSFGRKARVAIEESREVIADFINADPSEIYFTSCGTESTNLVINGIAQEEFNESGKDVILTTNGDHKATLLTIENLVEKGLQSNIVEIDSNFVIKKESLDRIDPAKSSLASIIHVNNETGSINNIEELNERLNGIYLHIDAVQSFGKFNLNVQKLGVDSLSASAHKLYGPKGIGIAYIRQQTPMSSLIWGGGQERNRRAGTENVAGIVGFAEAVKLANENMSANFTRVKEINDYLWDGLISSGIEGLFRNSADNSSPYILSVTFDPEIYQNDTEAILMFLDINGLAASAGSACTSGTLKPSHVILGAGYSDSYARGTIRLSFSNENTIEEMDYTIEIFKKLAEKNKKL